MTLASIDANSKLVDVVTVAIVDVQTSNTRFGQDFEVEESKEVTLVRTRLRYAFGNVSHLRHHHLPCHHYRYHHHNIISTSPAALQLRLILFLINYTIVILLVTIIIFFIFTTIISNSLAALWLRSAYSFHGHHVFNDFLELLVIRNVIDFFTGISRP